MCTILKKDCYENIANGVDQLEPYAAINTRWETDSHLDEDDVKKINFNQREKLESTNVISSGQKH